MFYVSLIVIAKQKTHDIQRKENQSIPLQKIIISQRKAAREGERKKRNVKQPKAINKMTLVVFTYQ